MIFGDNATIPSNIQYIESVKNNYDSLLAEFGLRKVTLQFNYASKHHRVRFACDNEMLESLEMLWDEKTTSCKLEFKFNINSACAYEATQFDVSPILVQANMGN